MRNFKFNHPFIENHIELSSGENYTAIIGSNPSKGARSPNLWNAAYKYYNMETKMYCFDVLPQNLNNLLSYLESTPEFLGGSIAVPYKESVAEWLGENLSPETYKIKSVNCIGRNGKGKLFGYNTDGQASLEAFEKEFGKISDKSILILGSGGAAKAVTAFFQKYLGALNKITLASRSIKGKIFAEKLDINWIAWNDLSTILDKTNIVVNCTSVGHGDFILQSPLSYEQVSLLHPDSFVYDIIYQPSPSLLLSHAKNQKLKILDGTDMNLQQAVIAFCLVNNKINVNKNLTKLVMLNYLNELN
jgi:shikimate dehydrogenase